MIKAPYVRPRAKGDTIVYGIRPTASLLEAFPKLRSETYDNKKDANERGFELKRKFDEWCADSTVSIEVDTRSVEALIKYYKSSMTYTNLGTKARKKYGAEGLSSTQRSYSDHLRHVSLVMIGKLPFSDMLVDNVDYDYAQRLWQHIADDVSAHKANHTFKVLKIIWNEGLRGGRVKSNPFSLVKLPKLPDRQVMWSIDEINGMIKYCDDQGYPSMGTMILMCYEFCQRPVDIRTFKWANIDGKTNVSNFRQRKTGKQMSIKVTTSISERLHLHKRRNTDDYIFAYENTGKPYSQDKCNKLFRKLAKGYGLPEVPLVEQFDENGAQMYSNIWLADLRRTGATHASRVGCTDRELVALTGHRNPQMLLVYAVEGEIESTNANTKRGLHYAVQG
tara:strand:+ start:251 stop:1426 length:1176 start_codon:yes stop_codon:yes gene_type:complete